MPIFGGNDTKHDTSLVEISIWEFHGLKDDVVPGEQITYIVEAMRAEGGSPRLTINAKGGHNILPQLFENEAIWLWLFEQRVSN